MSYAERLLQLFQGSQIAYGLYDLRNPKTSGVNGKVTGKPVTKMGQVTVELWQQHLDGEIGLGIIPIRNDSTCLWGAIDVDKYDLDHSALVRSVYDKQLPLVVCRTKSGGAHLYLFSSSAVSADILQDKLRAMGIALGLGSVEIFPKQRRVDTDRGDIGNWINMPYQGGNDTDRYAFTPQERRATLSEFLDLAVSLQVDLSQITVEKKEESQLFGDGPPCMQSIAATGGLKTGNRNNGLFQIGIFAKKKWPTDWKKRLYAINKSYVSPSLPQFEVDGIIDRLADREYNYTCTQDPIASFCNKELCKQRPYGIGSKDFPSLDNLAKQDTSENPYWFMNVDGTRVTLNTDQFMNFRGFQKICANYNIMVPPLKQSEYYKIITILQESVRLIPVSEDITVRGKFRQHLENFCTSRAQGRSKEDMLEGKPYTEDGYTYFRFEDLERHLNHHNFRDYDSLQIGTELAAMGGETGTLVARGKICKFWKISEFEKQTEPHPVNLGSGTKPF